MRNPFRFFAAAEEKPLILDSQLIDRLYRRHRTSIMITLTLGYGIAYMCRLGLSVVKKPLIDGGIFSAEDLGVIGSAIFYGYAFGKLVNGFLADHANIKRFLTAGVLLSALVNICMGWSTLLWSAFSFNSAVGQWEKCRGAGFEKIEMQFLSDIFIRCPDCNGRRYRQHILEVKISSGDALVAASPKIRPFQEATRAWRSPGGDEASPLLWSIADLLEATVDEVIDFLTGFSDSKPAQRAVASLKLLQEVGLGYLRLGQPINTLSGGESQRLKLVSHLVDLAPAPEAATPRPLLFLFDEPTTGLHFDDVRVLLKVFQRLADAGHSVVVIEQHSNTHQFFRQNLSSLHANVQFLPRERDRGPLTDHVRGFVDTGLCIFPYVSNVDPSARAEHAGKTGRRRVGPLPQAGSHLFRISSRFVFRRPHFAIRGPQIPCPIPSISIQLAAQRAEGGLRWIAN